MKRKTWLAAVLVLIGLACALLAFRADDGRSGLFVYCGAGIRPAMEDLRADFTAQTGIPVQVAYAGSGCLLSMLTFARSGDLYMPGEQEYADQARQSGFLDAAPPVAYFVAVVIVPKGNPKSIHTLADLARNDVRVGIGNPDSVACGLVARKVLEKAGLWDQVYANVTAQGACTATAMELSNALALHALDAVINWDAMAYPIRDQVDILAIPQNQNVEVAIPLGVLTWSRKQEEAARFVQFAQSAAGKAHFAEHGYHTDREPYLLAYYGDHLLD